MKSTSDVRDSQLARFQRHFRAWACGEGQWPQRISLGRPTTDALAGTMQPLKDWIADWRAWTGAGTVGWTPRRTVVGPVSCPASVTFDNPHAIASLAPEAMRTWTIAVSFLQKLEAHWPGTTPLAKPILSRIVELDAADRSRLIHVSRWLQTNPRSGLFVRQLPIEGIDTKWIEQHQALVATMLQIAVPRPEQHTDDAATVVPAVPEDLYERLGLQRPPRLINIVLCDPALRAAYGGARTLALTANDLAAMTPAPGTVLVIENKETGYAIPDRAGLLVIHGLGFNLKSLAGISWMHTARVLYWGDIDAAGFEWLSSLRGYGIRATSLLMTENTVADFKHLATTGALPVRRELPHLTTDERELHFNLVAGRWGHQFLLEQERLPWTACIDALDDALAGHSKSQS